MRADSIVLKTIQDRKLIQPGDRLLLGLSGGPDSLCLLDILYKLQPELNFKLYALHVNHKIRGAEADADMRAVIQICKERVIPLTVKTADIPAIAIREGMGEEEAGRKVRQQALRKKAQDLKVLDPDSPVKVVLAHNKDDQAETVLMRIIRGTGVHGLAAMEYQREDGLIRPLLDTPRTAIEEYCREEKLDPRIDSTNASLDYTRNRVRLRLIPMIEEEFNPNLKESLVRLADSAREDDSYIDSVAKANASIDWDSIPKQQLAEMDPAVAKRVIKLMFARVGLKQDIAAIHLNNLLDAVKASDSATIEFPKKYKALIQYDRVLFRAPQPEDEKEECENGEKPMRIFCGVIPIEELPPIRELGKNTCALDALKVLAQDSDVLIRNRRPGDKIKPLGLGGTKKLQDYMTDAKIPKEERDKIRLLCCGQQILWVEGFTVSDLCKVDEDTDFVLVTRIQEDQEIE